MNWKQYQNELIALAALVIMLFAYSYKHTQVTAHMEDSKSVESSIEEIKEVVALKKVWADKKINQKVEALQTLVPSTKVKWRKTGKKLTANYVNLSANELNKLITKILNLPVAISLLEVNKIDATYKVELKCKW